MQPLRYPRQGEAQNRNQVLHDSASSNSVCSTGARLVGATWHDLDVPSPQPLKPESLRTLWVLLRLCLCFLCRVRLAWVPAWGKPMYASFQEVRSRGMATVGEGGALHRIPFALSRFKPCPSTSPMPNWAGPWWLGPWFPAKFHWPAWRMTTNDCWVVRWCFTPGFKIRVIGSHWHAHGKTCETQRFERRLPKISWRR